MHYILGSKDQSSRSRCNNICWNRHCTGGSIQKSTSYVELDFLALERHPSVLYTVVLAVVMSSSLLEVLLHQL